MPNRFPVITFLALLSLLVSCAREPEQTTITIAGGAVGQELELTVDGVQRFMEENPDIRVDVRPIPSTTNERLALYMDLLGDESTALDVLQIDVIWAGIIEDQAIDLKQYIDQAVIDDHFEEIIQNNTVDGRLVGMPWFIDAPSLYYRRDLLEKYNHDQPPTSWEELREVSRQIMQGERSEGNLGFWGYVWQGKAYEGLTCNALEWQYSLGGGNFIDDQGKPNLHNSETASAFKMAAQWIGSISPPEVTEFTEDDSRVLWQDGNAAFMRNWSYVYSLIRDDPQLADKFGVAPLPGATDRAGTLGGWQLMVSRYSDHPAEAARLVQFLTSPAEQKKRAIAGTYSPSIPALYEDPEILEAAPFFKDFNRVVDNLIRRPSKETDENYDEVSEIYWRAVHEILNGAEAEPRLESAQEELEELLGVSSTSDN